MNELEKIGLDRIGELANEALRGFEMALDTNKSEELRDKAYSDATVKLDRSIELLGSVVNAHVTLSGLRGIGLVHIRQILVTSGVLLANIADDDYKVGINNLRHAVEYIARAIEG
jgi:hypothetical protein